MLEFLPNSSLLWLLPIALPIAVALPLLSVRGRVVARAVAPWTALPALLLAMLSSTPRSTDIPWLLLGTRLGLDETSRVFLFFTALLWLICGVFASSYLVRDPRRHLFLFFFLLSMSGNFGLILAQDMIGFYVGFALMSFASYGLVVHNRDRQARRAGQVYIAMVILGELLLFSGLVVAASSTGSILWQGLGDRLADSPVRDVAMWLLFFGLAVKAGALPVHIWLPVAHPAAPGPASAVLSGAMIKAGLIGWLRLLPTQFTIVWGQWGEFCIVLGLAAAFYAAAIGITQANPKTVLAYSSVSQMGLMTVGVGLAYLDRNGPRAALLAVAIYAMHHALAKGTLFLGVSVSRTNHRTGWRRWCCGLGLLLPALALSGMPFTSGALAKGVLKAAAEGVPGRWHDRIVLLLPLAAVATTLILARFVWLAWPRPQSSDKRAQQHEEASCGVWFSWTTLLGMVAFCVLVWPWGEDISVTKLVFSPQKVLATLWPFVLGTVFAVFWALIWIRGVRIPAPPIPAGDILEPIRWLGVSLVRTWTRGVARLHPDRELRARVSAAIAMRISRLSAIAGRTEESMRRSSHFGEIMLLIAALLLGLLMLR